MEFDTYYNLSRHPFVEIIHPKAVEIQKEVAEPNGFKVEAKLKRDLMEEEFYVSSIGYQLSHLLTVVQQMEHTVLYMSNFSPTEFMKGAGINRATHLIWSVENYLLRTQTAYDRLLVLIDRVFHLHNQPNTISHESIVTNAHIKRTNLPAALKQVKKSITKYYRERNAIIHEVSYTDDELRRIEALAILAEYEERSDIVTEEVKSAVRDYLKKKKGEYSRVNVNLCITLAIVFSALEPIYTKKYAELCAK
ncbi:MAG: hypothetical protein KUG81_01280 [Gammaproteobacteria bacterium]|nr:hypothetical protein [Gammaproteobacteria bacterium]